MHKSTLRHVAAAAVAVLAVTVTSFAQERSVSDLRITVDEWELVPTMVMTRVESFVALRDADDAVGDNITAVWFRRTGDADWDAYAWTGQDNLKSVAHVKGELGLDDSSDAQWSVDGASDGIDTDAAENPDEFNRGVIKGDPFEPVVDSLPEPGSFVEGLETSGWQAANISLMSTSTLCDEKHTLSALAATVEADLATGAGGTLVAGFSAGDCEKRSSISFPLDPDGDFVLPALVETGLISPSGDFVAIDQSPAPGTAYHGPQTIVVEITGIEDGGASVTVHEFSVTLRDITPPTLAVDLQGVNETLISPAGLKYFRAPVTLTAGVTSTDGVDGDLTQQAGGGDDGPIDIIIDCEDFDDISELTEPGFYRMRAKARDSSGNETIVTELFEVRDRLNLPALAMIESLTVTPNGATDIVDASVLLSAPGPDIICNMNPGTLSVWVADDEGMDVAPRALTVLDGYNLGHSYDPSIAEFDDCLWRINVIGELPAGAATAPGAKFYLTGSGAHGLPYEYDMISAPMGFVASADAEAQLRAAMPDDCGCDDEPEPEPTPLCRWVTQYQPDGLDHVDRSNSDGCGYENIDLLATADLIIGGANAGDWCYFGNGPHNENGSVVSGATMKVFLQPQNADCCDDCTISMVARPKFTARASVSGSGPADAAAGGVISVASPCGSDSAAGGVAVGDQGTSTITVTIGDAEVEIPVSGEDSDNKPFVGNLVCEHDGCSVQISVVTAAWLSAQADKGFWGSTTARASSSVGSASVGLTVTPDSSCDNVINDGLVFDYEPPCDDD